MDENTAEESPGPNRAFIPALRFRVLTPTYDTVIRLTTRERTVKGTLLGSAHLERASRLLDVGCGTGTFVIEAKRRYPHLDVVGVDPDPDVLARGRAKARRARVKVSFLTGSATDLPTLDNAFDRVTSSLVFHHLTAEQKRRAASEIARTLADGGEFHLADWVQPTNLLMRMLFVSVRLLDGAETTRDHAEGRLVHLLESGGLVEVVQHRTFATAAGTVGLLSASSAMAAEVQVGGCGH